MERWRSEQVYHDRQASERARDLRREDYTFNDADYLQHESWIRPAFDALGDVNGLRVLDLGCGHGMASVVLARRGADVTACDLSPGYVREAQVRADANGVQTRLLVCNVERLPFADASFDRIWGNAILHHLDLKLAARELHRVLAPSGVAVFCEPWGGNRWLNWARQRIPYPDKHHTRDESPLCRRDLACLRDHFPSMNVRGYQFLSMLRRVLRHDRLVRGLAWCDSILLRQLPHWQHYCRYVVLILSK